MNTNAPNDCFVIMPISDHADYDAGHFSRVYEHIIRPACSDAGLNPIRADDVQNTNLIILDILKRILDAPIAICDLSTRNPNVFYELGIRHAFNLPVVLIKDNRSPRVFDVQGIRTLDYDESLRVDAVKSDRGRLAATLTATIAAKGDVNSIVQLLGISRAELGNVDSITPDTALILDSIREVGRRITEVEESFHETNRRRHAGKRITLPRGEEVTVGDILLDGFGGDPVGELIALANAGIVLQNKDQGVFVVPPDDDLFKRLTTLPF